MKNSKHWNIRASQFAENTINPIRQVLENLSTSPNPEKSLIPLSIGEFLNHLDRENFSSRVFSRRSDNFRKHQTSSGRDGRDDRDDQKQSVQRLFTLKWLWKCSKGDCRSLIDWWTANRCKGKQFNSRNSAEWGRIFRSTFLTTKVLAGFTGKTDLA